MGSTSKKAEYLKMQYKWLGLTLIMILVFGLTVKAAYGMYSKSNETAEKAASSQKAVADLKVRHQAAKNNVTSVSSERGMDREIRARYGVKKPGEGVIILVDPVTQKQTTEEAKQDKSLLRFLGF